MPDKKLTDSEIVKALEEWRKELIADYQRLQLLDAPMDCFEESHADIITKLSNVLDLINRLQAENERLKNTKYIFATVDYCADDLDKALKENEELKSAINGFRGYEDKIKAEAYKEFAERLKQRAHKCFMGTDKAVTVFNIDDLLKEFVGGDNGK